MRHWAAFVAAIMVGRCHSAASAPGTQPQAAPGSRFLFVWAGDADKRDSDFLAVINVDPRSDHYAAVVARLPVGVTGSRPHHTEYEMPATGVLWANGFDASRTFRLGVFDRVGGGALLCGAGGRRSLLAPDQRSGACDPESGYFRPRPTAGSQPPRPPARRDPPLDRARAERSSVGNHRLPETRVAGPVGPTRPNHRRASPGHDFQGARSGTAWSGLRARPVAPWSDGRGYTARRGVQQTLSPRTSPAERSSPVRPNPWSPTK